MENQDYEIKPNVLDYEDIAKLVPKLQGHEKLVNGVLKFLGVDKVNKLHRDNCHTPGAKFTEGILRDLNIKLRIDNEEQLDNLPEGAFVTISNHPFGALDGISLIHIIASRRPKFKVMVNMVLNQISAMRPNFIAVNAFATDDPKMKAKSMQGLKAAIFQVRQNEPLGIFPAGAVAKMNWKFQLEDREWQDSVLRLLQQLKVPIIPIFFHGRNSMWSYFLSMISWKLRTLRLPGEVFRKKGKTIHISVGSPISVEEQMKHNSSTKEFGDFLRAETYKLRSCK